MEVETKAGELVPVVASQSGALSTYTAPNEALAIAKVSTQLFRSGMFPAVSSEAGAFTVCLYGRELGLGYVSALQNIAVIKGRLACNSQLLLSLAVQKASVKYEILDWTDTGCQIRFDRPGFKSIEVGFNQEDAERAGLIRPNSGYTTYPRQMYFWRAVALGVRAIAPDAVTKLYSIEEVTEGRYADIEDIAEADFTDLSGPDKSTGSAFKKEHTAAAKPPVGDMFIFRFGKHKGKAITEVDDGYLTWISHNEEMAVKNADTVAAAKAELARRKNGDKEPPEEASASTPSGDPARQEVIESIIELEAQLTNKDKAFKISEARTAACGSTAINEETDDALVAYMGWLQEKLKGISG